MSEYITVFIVLTFIVVAWFAMFISENGIVEGVKAAIFIPTMIVVVLSVVVWI